ncbi:MAG: hypothetical protein QW757_04590, partial [Candidatus Woesearchaeota archaeon]
MLNTKYKKKLFIILISIIFIYLLGLIFWDRINILLLNIPFFNSFYLKIITLYKTKSLLGLFLLTFLGSLFFLGFPGEVIYFIYIKTGYNILLISFLMIFSSLLAQIVNYLIGFFIEKKWLDSYIKEEKKHYK